MSAEELRNYHRTFVAWERPVPLQVAPPSPPPFDPQRVEPLPNRAPSMGPAPRKLPAPGTIASALTRAVRDMQPGQGQLYEAYLFNGTTAKVVKITAKKDQDFQRHATLWERMYSCLVFNLPNRFTPIVDQNIMVVGHTFVVREDQLVFIGDDDSLIWPYIDLHKLLELGPVFVGTVEHYQKIKNGKCWLVSRHHSEPGYGMPRYVVQTDIHGEVMAAEIYDRIQSTQIESLSFTMFIGVASLARSLINLGVRALVTQGANGIGTLARRFKRKPTAAPPITHSPRAYAPTNLANVREVYTRTLNEAGITLDTTGAGMALNRYALSDAKRAAEALAELKSGMEALTRRGAALEEKLAFLHRYNAKWGLPP